MNDCEVIGSGVIFFGFSFVLLGLVMGFNRRFIVTGDVLLLIGINLTMGIQPFCNLIISKSRLKGTIAFIIGVALVLYKLVLPGFLCQAVGIYWLFGGFISIVLSTLRHIPIIGRFIPGKEKDEDLLL